MSEEWMREAVFIILTAISVAGCRTLEGGASATEGTKPSTFTANPDEAGIVTSDIDRFWWAFNEATPLNDVRVFQEEYLRGGSIGLQEFARLKIGSVNNLAQEIWKHARYYASLRSSTRAIRSQEGRIRESFRKLKEIYPDALFPNVYFLIGSMNSGGIATDNGIIIGAELFSKAPSSPLDELNPWEKSVVEPVEKIPLVVAHELAHFEQRFTKMPETLLERSIAEGGADFISELIAGAQINQLQHEYGERHEQTLWSEFRKGMHDQDLSRWLYNGGALAETGELIQRPADLGYYVGYKICQAYYERATDKKKAVQGILEINDFGQFLKESGYEVTILTKR
jgi:hypothetical protein